MKNSDRTSGADPLGVTLPECTQQGPMPFQSGLLSPVVPSTLCPPGGLYDSIL
ncbi:MAG: hypothetical protein PUH21_01495 [Prevotellaceae bacterium]|nr:hypothetical protein [Prevotellaceae bacterium]MDY3856444.1 hypothetical protein [Bacteroidaceae bacterium]